MVIASININILLPHVDEIKYLVEDQGIDFLALNETKIDEELPDNLFKIDLYALRELAMGEWGRIGRLLQRPFQI